MAAATERTERAASASERVASGRAAAVNAPAGFVAHAECFVNVVVAVVLAAVNLLAAGRWYGDSHASAVC